MASVGIRKRNGKYIIRFRSKKGEKNITLPESFSKRAATALAVRKETEWALGTYDPFTDELDPVSVRYTSQVVREYISHKKQNGDWRTGESQRNKELILTNFVDSLHRYHQIDQLKTETLEKWVNDQDVGKVTQQTYMAQLLAFARWAVDQDYNTHRFSPQPIKVERHKFPEIYSVEELQTIIKGLHRLVQSGLDKKHTGSTTNTKSHYADYYWFLFYTGMRPGEIVHLKVRDVNIQDRLIYVGRNNPTKTNTERSVYIFDELLPTLDRMMEGKSPGAWLTRNRTMKRVSSTFRELRDELLPHKEAPMYNLRHSHGCWLMEQGFTSNAVAAQLGHVDPRSTRIYAVMTQRAIKNEFGRLNK